MVQQTLTIRRGENGEEQPISIKNPDGSDYDLSWITLADCSILFKDPDDLSVNALAITSADFTNSGSDIVWTPKDSDYDSLVNNDYVGFVHRKDTDSREVIAKFHLYIEDV